MMPDVNAWPQGFFYSEQSLANQPATLRIETSVFPTAIAFGSTTSEASAYATPTAIAWHSADSSAVSDVGAGSVSIRLTAETNSTLETGAGINDSDDNDAGITLNFSVNDWVLNGSRYELTLVHDLNFVNVTTDLYENGIPAFAEWVVVDANTIQLQVPVYPDGRFTGKATLHKVI